MYITNKIYYICHVLLYSKNQIFIRLLALLIYFFAYGDKLIDCMNENIVSDEIPKVAEAKPVTRETRSNLDQLIHRQIDEFAGLAETIKEQEKTITALENKLYEVVETKAGFYNPTSRVDQVKSIIGYPPEEISIHKSEIDRSRFHKEYSTELKNTYDRFMAKAEQFDKTHNLSARQVRFRLLERK